MPQTGLRTPVSPRFLTLLLAIVAGAVPVTIILALAVSDLSSHEPQRYFEARSLSSKLMLTPISATATRYDQQILPDPFGSDDIFIIKGYRLEPESDSAIESFYEARLTGDGWHVDSLEDDPVGQRLPGAPNLHMVFTKPGHYGDSLSYVVEYETDSHHLLLTLDSHI